MSKNQYEIFDQLQNPILIVDKDKKLIYYNHICSSYFKLPPRKLNKIDDINNLILTKESNINELIDKAHQTNSSQVSKEFKLLNPEDTDIENTVVLKYIPEGSNTIIHLIDFTIERHLHDKYKDQIEELKSTHEQIVTSDKLTALGEMVSGISHEISTPLVVISDRLEGLEKSLGSGDVRNGQHQLQDLRYSFRKVNQIIANMQSFIRNQEDRFSILTAENVINSSINFIKDLSILKNINLKTNFADNPLLLGNDVKLQQVIINLIKNSIDSLKDNNIQSPEININVITRKNEQTISITVEDNGPGVPENDVSHIFDMFYTTKEFGEGTGLGLAISQKIMEAHQGEIKYDNEYDGARFILEFPFVEIATFSNTNHYLQGEKEVEDKKVLLVGSNIDELNQQFQYLQEKDLVVIVTTDPTKIDMLSMFFYIDYIIYDKSINIGDQEIPSSSVSGFDENKLDKVYEIIKEISDEL